MELVLVVGAGASCELGLPSGAQLKEDIVFTIQKSHEYALKHRERDDVIADAFRVLSQTEARLNGHDGPLLNAAQFIKDGLPLAISIDNFLDAHRENDDIAICGKLAIVSCILRAEAGSSIMRSNDIPLFQESWLYPFFQILTENCSVNELPGRLRRIGIICFNYDRCIEQYMHYALQAYYSIDRGAAKELLDSLTIIHPYGSTGKLPWEEGEWKCAFGHEPDTETLLSISGQIKTFTEGTESNNSRISEVRKLLRLARRVVFLGFGFHPLNLELLYSKQAVSFRKDDSHVFATTYSMSDSNRRDIAESLSRLTGQGISPETFRSDLKCRFLLEEYRRKLSFT
jgi:hypothetical protein